MDSGYLHISCSSSCCSSYVAYRFPYCFLANLHCVSVVNVWYVVILLSSYLHFIQINLIFIRKSDSSEEL